MSNRNLFQISIVEYEFTVRYYSQTKIYWRKPLLNFGWRKLGSSRYSIDVPYISFLFEHYWRTP